MRLWLVRLFAALLAVALGVAVGAGPLQHSAEQRDRELAEQKSALRKAQLRIEGLTTAGEYASDYAAATGPNLVAGTLTGRTVGLVLLPGADPEVVEDLAALLASAGAKVSVRAAFDSVLATAESRQLVEALTSQMATQNRELAIPAGAAGFQRFGILLARALGADKGAGPKGSTYDPTAVGIVSGLTAAGLVNVTTASQRASLTVFVAGPAAASETEAAANSVPVTIIAAYASRTPSVLAGSADAAGPLGVLGALRADKAAAAVISGIDSVETPMGRVAVVLALADRVSGHVGQFGAVGASGGPVPPS